jgi:hypothetical protein
MFKYVSLYTTNLSTRLDSHKSFRKARMVYFVSSKFLSKHKNSSVTTDQYSKGQLFILIYHVKFERQLGVHT